MKNIAIVLTKEPYGVINAAEAVRHALGAASDDIGVSLILIGGGVLLAVKGQEESGTGFTNLALALKDCIDMGIAVGVEADSIKRAGIESEDILDGVEIMESSKIGMTLKTAGQVMIF